MPAKLVVRREMLCVPSGSVLAVIDHVPPTAVVLPTTVVPSSNSTVDPASAEPEKVGVLTLVILSVVDEPLSLAAAKSGVVMVGLVTSIVTVNAADAVPMFPAASLARAVMVCGPPASVLEVMVQFPNPSAFAEPMEVAPSNSVMSTPGSLVPLNVGVVVFVMLSLFEVPVSLASAKSGVEGAGRGCGIDDDRQSA